MTVKSAKRPTRRLPYCPRWRGTPFEGRAINMAKRLLPTLSYKGFDFDDLLQEAAMVFLICRRRYHEQARAGGKVVDNPAWFMALFGRALHNRFVDLQRQNFSYIPLDGLTDDEIPATDLDLGYCMCVLRELPADIRALLSLFAEGDDSVLPALHNSLMTKENQA